MIIPLGSRSKLRLYMPFMCHRDGTWTTCAKGCVSNGGLFGSVDGQFVDRWRRCLGQDVSSMHFTNSV